MKRTVHQYGILGSKFVLHKTMGEAFLKLVYMYSRTGQISKYILDNESQVSLCEETYK